MIRKCRVCKRVSVNKKWTWAALCSNEKIVDTLCSICKKEEIKNIHRLEKIIKEWRLHDTKR